MWGKEQTHLYFVKDIQLGQEPFSFKQIIWDRGYTHESSLELFHATLCNNWVIAVGTENTGFQSV